MSPEPMWKLTDIPVSWHLAHSRSQCGSPSLGMPQKNGSPVMITPLWPRAMARSISFSVSSRSQNGRAMIGMNRSGAIDEYSARKSLYARTQASISSPSPIVSILPAPKPATFGYSTAPQMPYLSMMLRRSLESHVALSTTSSDGGCFGGNSFQPACAAPAAAPVRFSPKYQASSLNFGSKRTWGTLSPHLSTSRRDVHRSYGSMMCVSVSMTL